MYQHLTKLFLPALTALVLTVSLPISAALAQSKIVFVTSETTDGSIDEPGFATGIASADAICNRLAAAAGPANIPAAAVADGFKAWLSDATTTPSVSFTQATVPYKLVNGTTIAPNWAGLTDSTLDSAISLDQNGVAASLGFVWTSTLPDGTRDVGFGECLGWHTNTAGVAGLTGDRSSTDRAWTRSTSRVCSLLAGIYCFQQGTADGNSVPTASSVSIAGTAKVGNTLTGSYTYADVDGDAEGTSTFKWLRDGTPIGSATASTYLLVAADSGKTIKFEVTPVAATGASPGAPVAKAISGLVMIPPPQPIPVFSPALLALLALLLGLVGLVWLRYGAVPD